MVSKKFIPFIVLSFVILQHRECMGQQDSIIYEEIIDTIIIQKDPVIIKKEVVVLEEKQVGPFAVEFFLQPLYYSNYYDVCESCKNYLDKLKQASSPSFSFSSGIHLVFSKKRIYGSVGMGYTSIKENFSYTDSSFGVSGKNTYNYLDINFLSGYVIFQKKFNVLLYAGAGINKLLSAKGFTFSKADSTLSDIKSENTLADFNQRIIAGVNASFMLSEKVNFSAGPEYSVNLRSVVRRDHYYVLQRNMFGLKLSLLYFL